ncbi:hypothetical protein BZG36_00698 [Bifiguratus adelaidae]|uniref:Metallo-beta-lactamase domain-containing protein n=1 Tax=Bifiguratus adelaidae TaxID=1938954 RepID=A0A261Y6T6_9FUNG|nr:hypothetical protein BZG36_00698 [Bifiguratus adelaidae]
MSLLPSLRRYCGQRIVSSLRRQQVYRSRLWLVSPAAFVSTEDENISTKAHHRPDRFVNPWPSFTEHSFWSSFKVIPHLMSSPASRSVKSNDVPHVQRVNWERVKGAQRPKADGSDKFVQATWLGHACFLVQINGFNVLFDPVFSDRCSPVQFAGPKRYTPPPCDMDDLPDIDAVIISHNQ